MITVNIHEAKTNLSKLIAAVEERGEVIRICRNGKLVAELNPPATVERKQADLQTSQDKTSLLKKKRNIFEVDPKLKVIFHEDPMKPLDEEDWGDLV